MTTASIVVEVQQRWIIGLAVWLSCAAYLSGFVEHRWIAHDEGYLGYTAERCLGGQLPHRDFFEGYTGGLIYLHAFAFWLGGIDIAATRWLFYFFTLLFVPAVYLIAVRAAPPLGLPVL